MEILVGERYKHYKGNTYKVLCIGKHADTHEEYVVYQGEYTDAEFGKDPIWTRPSKDFTSSVSVEGKTVQRFTMVNI